MPSQTKAGALLAAVSGGLGLTIAAMLLAVASLLTPPTARDAHSALGQRTSRDFAITLRQHIEAEREGPRLAAQARGTLLSAAGS